MTHALFVVCMLSCRSMCTPLCTAAPKFPEVEAPSMIYSPGTKWLGAWVIFTAEREMFIYSPGFICGQLHRVPIDSTPSVCRYRAYQVFAEMSIIKASSHFISSSICPSLRTFIQISWIMDEGFHCKQKFCVHWHACMHMLHFINNNFTCSSHQQWEHTDPRPWTDMQSSWIIHPSFRTSQYWVLMTC